MQSWGVAEACLPVSTSLQYTAISSGAGLVELGAQAHVARLDYVQLELLLAAAVRQLLKAVPQALVHPALACNSKTSQPSAISRCSNHEWITACRLLTPPQNMQ